MIKRKLSVVSAAIVVVVLILVLAGCGENGSTGGSTEEQKDYFQIKTDYGNLRYPDQWKDVSKIDVSGKDGVMKVVFRGKVNGKTFSLFTVQIGGEGTNAVGSLTDKNGKTRNIYMKTTDLEKAIKGKKLSKNAVNRLYAMQEDINFVIDNLR